MRTKKTKAKGRAYRPRRTVVNVSMTRYALIQKIAKYEFGMLVSDKDLSQGKPNLDVMDGINERGIEILPEPAKKDTDEDHVDIFWMDGAGPKLLERLSALKNHQRVNHFPGMSILSRKNELAKLLNFMSARFRKDFDFYPRSWVLPQDQR